MGVRRVIERPQTTVTIEGWPAEVSLQPLSPHTVTSLLKTLLQTERGRVKEEKQGDQEITLTRNIEKPEEIFFLVSFSFLFFG